MSSNYLPEDVELVDSKATESLQFIDLLILYAISCYNEDHEKAPTGEQIKQWVNDFITHNNISEAFCTPIGTNYKLQGHIEKMRGFDLILNNDNTKTPYFLTEKGEKLLRNIPTLLNWNKMPVVIPMKKGKPDLKKAVYINS